MYLDVANGKIEKPDGIICGNDIMAVEVCRTLMENDVKVPEDIKVTGVIGKPEIARSNRAYQFFFINK